MTPAAPHARRLPPFERVLADHGRDVWRFGASQVGTGRADDVFQETMLAALTAYPTLRDPAAVRSWLFQIAARKSIDTFRSDGRAPRPVPEPDQGATVPGPESPDEELWERARALPEKQRHALALRHLLDMPYAEIAAVMETSAEAARRNAFEALRSLRRALDPADENHATTERKAAKP